MLNPKEKAEEIFDLMFLAIRSELNDEIFFAAKKCTIVAIDEMIKIVPTSDYLLSVKHEAENI